MGRAVAARPPRGPPSPGVQRLIDAAERAAHFLVPGNGEGDFKLTRSKEVDPGSIASEGTDGRGQPIWVVDQKVRLSASPPDLGATFLDGFFTGGCFGKAGNGPRARLIAAERNGVWTEAAPGESSASAVRASPFADPAITRFIVALEGVRPTNAPEALVPPSGMAMVVDKRSAVRSPERAEFTCHFLNPQGTQGPFPGTTDGAVRFRASRERPGGPTTVEGYYLTRAATQYLDPLTGTVRPLKAMKSAMEAGRALFEATPLGWMTRPFTRGMTALAEGVTDKVIGATGMVWDSVATLHARYYREVLFPNVLGG